MASQTPSETVNDLTSQSNAFLLLPLLLLVDSLHFVFARLLLPHLPGGTSAFYVLATASGEVTVYMLLSRKVKLEILRKNLSFFLLIGLLVAASTAINYIAVGYIDPGTASLLAQTATIFALVLSVAWLKENLNRREIAGSLIAIMGVIVISFQPGDYLRVGSLLILASALMYATHTAIVKRHGGDMDFANFFLFRVTTVSAFLFLFASARGQLLWPSGQAWLILLLAGTVDVVVSRILFYLALRRFQMSFHTIFLTLSPVITVIWSFFLFDLRPSEQSFVGGLAVIAGVAIVTFSRSKNKESEMAESSQV